MKILFCLDLFGFFGGPERRAFRIAKGLKLYNNHDVNIISIMKADEKSLVKAKKIGIQTYSVTSEGNSALKSYRIDVFLKLRKMIKNLNPDAVFTFEFLADYTTKLALLKTRIPILTFIGSTEWKWERKLHRKLAIKKLSEKSKIYMVNSQQVKHHLIRVLPKVKNKISILHNPIDTEYFKPLSQNIRNSTRKKYGIPVEAFVVGSVVRFYNPKGADVLVEAFFKSKLNAILVLIGDGNLKEKLIEMVNRYGITNRVKFLGALEATPEIYSMFDVCVVPSQKGGFDNVVVESMACGIPTIATYATGILEVADRTSVTVCGTNPDDISTALTTVCSDERSLENTGRNGRLIVENKLTLRKTVKKLEEILNALC